MWPTGLPRAWLLWVPGASSALRSSPKKATSLRFLAELPSLSALSNPPGKPNGHPMCRGESTATSIRQTLLPACGCFALFHIICHPEFHIACHPERSEGSHPERSEGSHPFACHPEFHIACHPERSEGSPSEPNRECHLGVLV